MHKVDYESLDETVQEIRLLKVNPGRYDEPIECMLEHASLSDHPTYETISYCWGRHAPYESIQLEDVQVMVSSNTAAAIRRMRRIDSVRCLWIDSLCIDQDNVEERSRQVAMMRDIYGQAQCNLVHLGDQTELGASVALAISAVNQALVAEARVKGVSKRALLQAYYDGPASTSMELSVMELPDIDYDCLGQFLSLPWFSRVWVVQEAALSRSNACFLGEQQLDIIQISRMVRWCFARKRLLPPILRDGPGIQQFSLLGNLLDVKHGVYRDMPTVYMSIASLLEKQQYLQATDPRDRVFALVFLTKFGRMCSSLPSELQPDYNKAEATVFLDATKLAIQERGLHRILMFVSHRSAEDLCSKEWPSWMPWWNRPIDKSQDPNRLVPNLCTERLNTRLIPSDLFQGSNTLSVRGSVFDKVAQCSAVLETDTPEIFEQWLIKLLRVFSLTSIEMAQRQVAARMKQRARYGHVSGRIDIDSLVQSLLKDDVCGGSRRHATLYRKVLRSLCSSDTFGEGLTFASLCRRFFETKSGAIGIGPRVLQPGDLIVEMDGVSASYALRSTENAGEYRLLGHCHVNDWPGCQRHESPRNNFILR